MHSERAAENADALLQSTKRSIVDRQLWPFPELFEPLRDSPFAGIFGHGGHACSCNLRDRARRLALVVDRQMDPGLFEFVHWHVGQLPAHEPRVACRCFTKKPSSRASFRSGSVIVSEHPQSTSNHSPAELNWVASWTTTPASTNLASPSRDSPNPLSGRLAEPRIASFAQGTTLACGSVRCLSLTFESCAIALIVSGWVLPETRLHTIRTSPCAYERIASAPWPI